MFLVDLLSGTPPAPVTQQRRRGFSLSTYINIRLSLSEDDRNIPYKTSSLTFQGTNSKWQTGRTGNLVSTIQYQGTQKHQIKIECIVPPFTSSDL